MWLVPTASVAAQGEVCATCHEDIAAGREQATSSHQPVSRGECSSCHNPHTSKLPTLLRAPDTDLCLSCHDGLKERLAAGFGHSPVGKDCLACHLPHFSRTESSLLTAADAALCGECHDLEGSSFGAAHIGIDAGVMNCESCHDPHVSKDPMLFKANMHAPFVDRSCSDCHLAAGQ